MPYLDQHAGFHTDHYVLSMAQGCFLNSCPLSPATFDLFFRDSSFSGGLVAFQGLQGEAHPWHIQHVHQSGKSSQPAGYRREELLRPSFTEGKTLLKKKPYADVKAYLQCRLSRLPGEQQQFDSPPTYILGFSDSLRDLPPEEK